MANPNAEVITSGADRFKVGVAIVAAVGGIVGYYVLAPQPMVVRLAAILAGLLIAAAIAWFSGPGQRLFAFANESWNETRRVVWPSRKETWSVTLYVFAFVVVMAIFLWIVDKALEWALYDLVLGWR